ncbi:hypothetical protein SVIOM342S_02943 [Streptomyces violaceorubidus]
MVGHEGDQHPFKGNLDPLSGVGRAIDGSLNNALKIATHIGQAVSGD